MNSIDFSTAAITLPDSKYNGIHRYFPPHSVYDRDVWRRAPFASVCAFSKTTATFQLPVRKDRVREHITNTDHPGEVCDLRDGRCAQLMGVGCAALSGTQR
jgi:hypothetical protein